MKKIMIANGKYTKDGQEKTNWVKMGVIGVSQNGKEYMLLDPTINLAGFPREAGKDMVMCSIFDDSQQGGQYNQQQAPQGQYQAPAPTYQNQQGQQVSQGQYQQHQQQELPQQG